MKRGPSTRDLILKSSAAPKECQATRSVSRTCTFTGMIPWEGGGGMVPAHSDGSQFPSGTEKGKPRQNRRMTRSTTVFRYWMVRRVSRRIEPIRVPKRDRSIGSAYAISVRANVRQCSFRRVSAALHRAASSRHGTARADRLTGADCEKKKEGSEMKSVSTCGNCVRGWQSPRSYPYP